MGTKDYLGKLLWNQITRWIWWFLCKSPRSTINDRNRIWRKINREKIPIRLKHTGIDERLVLRCRGGLGEQYLCCGHGKMKVGEEDSPRLNLRSLNHEGKESNKFLRK